MIFFGSIYQSLITSFLIDPMVDRNYKVFDDLLESNKIIYIPEYTYDILQENSLFQKALKSGRIVQTRFLILTESVRKNYSVVFPQPCRIADFHATFKFDKKISFGRNIIRSGIDQKIITLDVKERSPFIDKFQYLMNLCFEAGLLKAWSTFHENDLANLFKRGEIRRRLLSELPMENVLLTFRQILPMFFILPIGYLISCFTLLLEIFYRDFLSKLNRAFFMKVIKKRRRKFAKRRKEICCILKTMKQNKLVGHKVNNKIGKRR